MRISVPILFVRLFSHRGHRVPKVLPILICVERTVHSARTHTHIRSFAHINTLANARMLADRNTQAQTTIILILYKYKSDEYRWELTWHVHTGTVGPGPSTMK